MQSTLANFSLQKKLTTIEDDDDNENFYYNEAKEDGCGMRQSTMF